MNKKSKTYPMGSHLRRICKVLSGLVLSFGTACSPPPDPAAQVAPDAASCLRVGQACRLGPGRLGICEVTEGAKLPFRCSTQH